MSMESLLMADVDLVGMRTEEPSLPRLLSRFFPFAESSLDSECR